MLGTLLGLHLVFSEYFFHVSVRNRRDLKTGAISRPHFTVRCGSRGVRAAKGYESQLMVLNRDQRRKRNGVTERVVHKDLRNWDLP